MSKTLDIEYFETLGVLEFPPALISLCQKGFNGVSDQGWFGYSFTWTFPQFHFYLLIDTWVFKKFFASINDLAILCSQKLGPL